MKIKNCARAALIILQISEHQPAFFGEMSRDNLRF